jgi:DNA-binding NarL/FixJ family response regulator
MSTDPRDLLQQRAVEAAQAQKASVSAPTAPLRRTSDGLAGEGVSNTAELARLISMLKQAETENGVAEKMIVIGEFSVLVSRVPETFLAQLQTLTRMEAAVIRMLGWGRSNTDIAMLMDSNENTIRTHMNNSIRKLELDGMRELMTLAGLLFHPLD